MVTNFFIKRPIAVLAIFFSILVLGFYGWLKIPTSLLPDADTPEISIEVRKSGISAESMERTVLNSIRQSVVGSFGLRKIESESIPGFGRVTLAYEYGTNMDLALTEVNERIDRIVSSLPKDMTRPVVRKKKPADIPVIFIHLTSASIPSIDLSQLVRFELSKRFEQLKGVAQIETSGTVKKSIQLQPKMDKIIAAGLDLVAINKLIEASNLPIGQILVRDGNYEYQVEIKNMLADELSVKTLVISNANGQQVTLGDLFEVTTSHLNPQNKHLINGKEGIVMAIFSQPDADLFLLQESILNTLHQLEEDLPEIEFTISQNQICLLAENINQFYLTAGLAILFAFVVFSISSKSSRLPLILGTVLPASILISIGTLYLMGLTLNIITLSGFILGIGLLVDNVIILIEEINQQYRVHLSMRKACIVSVSNIFPALLSSTLTTICVFIPLLTIDGIASELFKEQAVTLVVILCVSLVLCFVLIPTFYVLWIKNGIEDLKWLLGLKQLCHANFKVLNFVIIGVIFGLGILSYNVISTEELPVYEANDYEASILWNEPISLEENKNRVGQITSDLSAALISANLGISGITTNETRFFDEANLYVHLNEGQQMANNQLNLVNQMTSLYPKATISFSKSSNPFEMVFYRSNPLAMARIRKVNGSLFDFTDLQNLQLINKKGKINTALNETYKVNFLKDRIQNSSINYPFLLSHLKNLSDEQIITSIKYPEQSIPIVMTNNESVYFAKKDSSYIDISSFYELEDTVEVRKITADLSGPYLSYETNELEDAIAFGEQMSLSYGWIYDLDGQLIESQENLKQLLFAGILGVTLLYLILSAQFESFSQPFIIFSIIPIAIFGSLIGLTLFGETINIMSIIGIIVMLGIIVNDCILKIDAINRNLKAGFRKQQAIIKAKDDRFKPILMTSLSTILALVPILTSNGIAADLQKPLAVAVISGLIVGTWSSIFILPFIYDAVKR